MERPSDRDGHATAGANLPATPEVALRQARMVSTALILGPLLFYGTVYLLDSGLGGASPDVGGLTPRLAFMLWAVLALGLFPVALFFRNRAAGKADAARRTSTPLTPRELGEVTVNSTIASALMESPALLAGVLSFLLSDTQLIPWAAFVFLVGMGIVFPRADWYGVDVRRL